MYPLLDTKKQVLEIAKRKGWDNVVVMGDGDMIDRPQTIGEWMVYPADQYPSEIPQEGMNRVYQLVNAGVRIKGVAVLDDLRHPRPRLRPILLPPPTPEPIQRKWVIPHIDVDWGFVFSTTAKILLGTVAVGLAVIAGIALLAVALAVGTALLILAGVGAALAYDPALVVVTEDNQWVAVYMWLEH
jgi:hypothetical protein